MQEKKVFFVNSASLGKWMQQNGVNDSIIDCREGVLLDSFIAYTKSGIAAVYENYVSPWVSNYRVEFSRDDRDPEIWEKWDSFCNDYDMEYGG